MESSTRENKNEPKNVTIEKELLDDDLEINPIRKRNISISTDESPEKKKKDLCDVIKSLIDEANLDKKEIRDIKKKIKQKDEKLKAFELTKKIKENLAGNVSLKSYESDCSSDFFGSYLESHRITLTISNTYVPHHMEIIASFKISRVPYKFLAKHNDLMVIKLDATSYQLLNANYDYDSNDILEEKHNLLQSIQQPESKNTIESMLDDITKFLGLEMTHSQMFAAIQSLFKRNFIYELDESGKTTNKNLKLYPHQ